MKQLTTVESMYSCVRCGACREACPTLSITGREADGPRGRVLMARNLIEGVIPVNDEIKEQLDRCLLCSACVDACPVDVAVPDIVMMAKEKISEVSPQKGVTGTVGKWIFRKLLPFPRRLQKLGHLLWIYQKSGLQNVVRKLGVMKLFPESLQQMERAMPEILPPSRRSPHPPLTPSERKDQNGPSHSAPRAALFQGCIMDMMFRSTNENTIRFLAKSGFDVVTPGQQVCCGALHTHNGEKQTAVQLAKKNIEVFEQANVDYIVSNAGGCGAMLREYEELFRDDPEWLPRARKFCQKVKDVSEVAVQKGTVPQAAGQGERITYQPSCHLQYVMGVKDAPKKLLRSVADAQYVELPEAGYCCGSAGIYNLLQEQMANDILDKKMGNVAKTRANVIVTANPGCLLQMKMGIERAGMKGSVEAVHIVDYMVEAMERNNQSQTAENQEKLQMQSV